MRPGSPGYEAKEAATASLLSLGPTPVRAAAAALSDLQVSTHCYAHVLLHYALGTLRMAVSPSTVCCWFQALMHLLERHPTMLYGLMGLTLLGLTVQLLKSFAT